MSTFIKLNDFKKSNKKEIEFFNAENRYKVENQEIFLNIPNQNLSYWIKDNIIKKFQECELLESICIMTSGMMTSDNDKFLRYWYEVSIKKVGFNLRSLQEAEKSGFKWFPYNKGGPYRKWFGNNYFLVNWENDGLEIKECIVNKYKYLKGNYNFVIRGTENYFKEGLTWSALNNNFSLRYATNGFLIDTKGASMFLDKKYLFYILGLMNTKVSSHFLEIVSATLDFNPGNVGKTPIIFKEIGNKISTVDEVSKLNIKISKSEWDSRETSWDFTSNELLKQKKSTNKLNDAFNNYCEYWKNKFFELHKNEEEINKISIDIYGLQDELTPDVALEDITILKDEAKIQNNTLVFKKDVIIKQFLSYAIGCIFGRYSPDKEGLILANSGETMQDFMIKNPNPSFYPDDDNIVPVLDDEYFTDDLFTRFKEFLSQSFGKDSLYENMDFIADAVDKRSNENSEQAIRRYFLNDLFKDHCKMYNNRPIYWYFTSGKEKAFNALIYMHRYNKELLAKMRIEYLIKLEEKLIAQKTHLDTNTMDSNKKQQALSKRAELNKKIQEIRLYDEKLKHLADQYIEIDLDDGVKNNYKLFEEITAKI
jgi:type II restriction/modification system DNA methylase subunit YeeA